MCLFILHPTSQASGFFRGWYWFTALGGAIITWGFTICKWAAFIHLSSFLTFYLFLDFFLQRDYLYQNIILLQTHPRIKHRLWCCLCCHRPSSRLCWIIYWFLHLLLLLPQLQRNWSIQPGFSLRSTLWDPIYSFAHFLIIYL